ncbi:MAG TPA: hypothetical protein PKD10_11140 [Paracoccaceae bacterium]|nr:hypothetical protein [Paracoccaceae bacterium]HMO72488.1 hypothetical protein [Paracoccaceae bacterium]
MFRLLIAPALTALALGLAVLPVAAPLRAETAAPEAAALALTETMRIGAIVEVLREEGIDYGMSLEGELFPGRGGAAWRAAVERIYDTGTMRARFDRAFAAEMARAPEAIAAAQAFFGDARGQNLLGLEIEARRALLDEAVEDAARTAAEDMAARDDPRMGMLRRFAEANDLIDANVQGALNANLAFYRGMVEAGAMGEDMTEDQMLADVWGQEAEIRSETEDWLYPFLALAYGPLPDADLQAYTDYSLTPAGKRLNLALFAAFDAVFTAISLDLGRAAALQMMGEDI